MAGNARPTGWLLYDIGTMQHEDVGWALPTFNRRLIAMPDVNSTTAGNARPTGGGCTASTPCNMGMWGGRVAILLTTVNLYFWVYLELIRFQATY